MTAPGATEPGATIEYYWMLDDDATTVSSLFYVYSWLDFSRSQCGLWNVCCGNASRYENPIAGFRFRPQHVLGTVLSTLSRQRRQRVHSAFVEEEALWI